MTGELQKVCHHMREAYHQGSALVLLFDYDGTLTPIVEHPCLAKLDHNTIQILRNLAARPRVHLGVLSGRDLDQLKSLVPVPNIYFAGTAGLEIELRGLRLVHPDAHRMATLIRRLAVQMENEVAVYKGVWIEKKTFGLTLHYRQMQENQLESLKSTLTQILLAFAGELRIVPGPKAWEITPANSWNKGTAVRLILADSGASSDILFYAGDGANDREAMMEVEAMGGITLGLGPDAPRGTLGRLPNQLGLLAFLSHLRRELEASRGPTLQPADMQYGVVR